MGYRCEHTSSIASIVIAGARSSMVHSLCQSLSIAQNLLEKMWRKIESHKMLDGLKLSVSNYPIQFDRCAWLKFVECWQENESNRQTSTVDWILMNNSCKWQSVVLAVCLVLLVALLFFFSVSIACNSITLAAYLMITFSVDGDDESNAARFMLILRIVESLSFRRFPIHQRSIVNRFHVILGRVAWRCHYTRRIPKKTRISSVCSSLTRKCETFYVSLD